MSFMFTVSPDFTPSHISGWYIFNSWLQRLTDTAIHLEMYNDFKSQRVAIESDSIDLIYANPFDAAMLIREKGFQAVARPIGKTDEAILAVNVENTVEDVAHLAENIRVAFTDAPDVEMIGRIMLEPGDFTKENITATLSDTYVLVAKQLLQGEADVGFFLAEAYDDLSSLIKKKLRVLVRSEIDVIHHSLLISPKLLDKRLSIQKILVEMVGDEKGNGVLDSLGFTGWEAIGEEEVEFMIDLMDTLTT
ncbi:MAG: phosphate/phosphite/phosphonate ABC transporter substrate-binding protein [Methylococcales bacterium]|nr:phosphate/phosphite/phosphonate ABC transporter substrate-binding protein [Methylococcales bacterium]